MSAGRGRANLGSPPPDVLPEHLFIDLLELSPSRALQTRLAGLEEVELFVHAVSGTAVATAMAAASRFPAAEVRRSRYTLELLARCLWTEEGRAFGSANEVGALTTREIRDLADEAITALADIAPTYAFSEWKLWHEVLERGARHPMNAMTAISLAGCADYGHTAITFTPETFWGVPRVQLLDGHWMLYRAARAAWVKDESPPGTIAEAIRRASAGRG